MAAMAEEEGTHRVNDLLFAPAFLEDEGLFDAANDDFDPLEIPRDSPEDGHWVSCNQEKEQYDQHEDAPAARDWKDVPNDDVSNMRVSVDKARRFPWKRAKTETLMLRKHWNKDHPSFDSICDSIHGMESELFHLFRKKLDLDHQTLCRFVAALFTASMSGVPAPRMHDNNRFKTDGLLKSEDEFLSILRRMENVDENTERVETLWMKLERTFNNEMREIFLSKRSSEDVVIALDDDKVHFNHSKHSKNHSPKRCRHIKDNRFGHTLHTAGFSATGAILAAAFEREGETQTACHEKVLKGLFGANSGNGAPDLRGTTWCSDRGCWTAPLLFFMLLSWGADVVGTVARCPWHPFTFKKGRSNDENADGFERTEVQMKGCKDVFYKTLDWVVRNTVVRKIRATCCRPGTGSAVSLAMSAIHNHGPLFDLNLSFPRDHRFFTMASASQAVRDAKAFPCVCGASESYDLVKNLPIIPLTCAQCDVSWFIMRWFGLSSSTVDNMITARASEIVPSHESRAECTDILRVVDRLDLMPAVDGIEVREVTNENTESDDENDPDLALQWIHRVNEGEQQNFLDVLDTLEDEVIKRMVELHEHSKPTQTAKTLRKQLKKWAEQDHKLKRKHHWFTKNQLITAIKNIQPSAKTAGLNDPLLLDLVVEVSERQERTNAAIAAGQDPFTEDFDPVPLQVFKSAFMKPLKDDAKKCTRKGHELERPFLEQFFDHGQRGMTGDCKALAIFESPLVQTTVADLPRSAVDSSDAELVHSFRGGEPEVMPMEIKARLAHSTFYDERYRFEANLGLLAFEEQDASCVTLNADSDDLRRWMPKHKEAFQLLHHVAVRDLRKGLLLVGNSTDVMFGVFVCYSERLIRSYQATLRDLTNRSLVPFYAPHAQLEEQMPHKKIEDVMNTSAMRSVGLSMHSFTTNFFIWRRIRLEGDAQLPIPPCNRILPYNHSYWNNLKGASDAATKLFWNCQVKLANHGKSQTVCIARFLQLHAACVHRQNHIATAKTDPNFYGSLHHFRNTKNRHWPFHKTLREIGEWLIRKADESDEENLAPIEVVPICQTPVRTRGNVPRHPFEEDRTHATTCGATPGHGKPKFPKNVAAQVEEDWRRFESCPGNSFQLNGKQRRHCWLCDTKTSFVCTGCKRAFCMVNRYDKVCQLVVSDAKITRFLDGKCPPATLKVHAISEDGEKTPYETVQNSCYHVCHKNVVSRNASLSLRNPLSSIDEPLLSSLKKNIQNSK